MIGAPESCAPNVDKVQLGPVATDEQGVVRFDKLPDGSEYRLQLIHILEAWSPDADHGGDWLPKPDVYRRRDGTTHAVRPCVTASEQVVRIDHLSEDEKFAHFRDAYVDNGAVYVESRPNTFSAEPPRWNWGKGAVCNQHVNFFLGYWLNYNDKFTTRASATFMDATTALDSSVHIVTKVSIRGYKEFLEEIPASDLVYHHPTIDRDIRYLRICNASFGGAATSDTSLFGSLGDINVYSVSDIPQKQQPAALSQVRSWLAQHPERLPPGKTAAGMTEDQLWNVVWMLDARDPVAAKLLASLQSRLNIDHHAGVLFKRDDDLYTFSADGVQGKHPKIVVKHFATHDVVRRKFLHLGLWKTRRLRPGGYAPQEAENNAGAVSIHNLTRFIHWTP